jgi:hypothetical protein
VRSARRYRERHSDGFAFLVHGDRPPLLDELPEACLV